MTARTETQRGFTLTRTLDAPRDLVFQAWTDPDHLHWFFNPNMTPPGERAADPADVVSVAAYP